MALDLPAGPRAALGAWRDRALAGRDELRLVPAESLHVTLAFLGNRPETEIDRVEWALATARGDLTAPLLAPGAVVALPRRRPRLLALELSDAGGRAAAVQGAVSAALAEADLYVPERRAFWPHVTLARVRGGAGWSQPAGIAPLDPDPPPTELLTCEQVTLYRSQLRSDGARYEPLGGRRLGAG